MDGKGREKIWSFYFFQIMYFFLNSKKVFEKNSQKSLCSPTKVSFWQINVFQLEKKIAGIFWTRLLVQLLTSVLQWSVTTFYSPEFFWIHSGVGKSRKEVWNSWQGLEINWIRTEVMFPTELIFFLNCQT